MAQDDVSIVAYLRGTLGEFLAGLTRSLAPATPAGQPHLTLLPPISLSDADASIAEHFYTHCAAIESFEIHLRGVGTFLPLSEVLYLELDQGAGRAAQIHRQLRILYNSTQAERFRYHPHVTLAYGLPPGEVAHLAPLFAEAWRSYRGPRAIHLDQLTMVRESGPLCWRDLATLTLDDSSEPAVG